MASLVAPLVTAPIQRLIEMASDATIGAALEEIRLIRGVERGKGRLVSMLEKINMVLAERNQSEHGLVGSWLDELSQVAYDAEDVLDEFAADAALLSRRKKYSPIKLVRKLRSKHNLSRQLKSIWRRLDDINANNNLGVQKVVDITTSSQTQHARSVHPPLQPTTGFVPFKEYLVPKGRESEREKISDWLFHTVEEHCKIEVTSIDDGENISFFSIFGMGGMGKTTLAQSVYSNDRVNEFFQARMWVCVSNDDFDITRITREMMSALDPSGCSVRHDVPNLEALQQGVRDKVAGKKFLLVLDDVWKLNANWRNVFNPLKVGKKGSKVLITTRDKRIADEMAGGSGQNTLHLEGLSQEDALSILKNKAFAGKNMDSNMKSVCVEISKKLGGSPLAAKIVGGLLNENFDRQYWESVVTRGIGKLQQHGEDGIMPILRLSYERLPPHLKECFAYCSLFPQDYKFKRDKLIRLWMAQGLVKPGDEMQTLEYWGSKHLDDLVSLSLFEQYGTDDGDDLKGEDVFSAGETYYVMHDLIHDLAVSVSQDRCIVLKGGDCCKGKFPKRVRHLSWRELDHIAELQSDLANILQQNDCSGLRSLHLESESPNINYKDVFKTMKRLRVLRLIGCPVRRLPSSISRLKHLRFLALLSSHIEELPDESLGGLCNLQVLSMWANRLIRLPEGVGNLTSLRVLQITWSEHLKELPASLGKLCNLQVLDLQGCRQLGKLAQGVVCKLTDLRRLDLSWTSIEELPEDVSKLCNLEVLKLLCCRVLKKLPDRVGDLTCLSYLDVDKCDALRELPVSIGELANLRRLAADDALLCKIAHPGGMTSLQELCTVAHPRELKHMKELRRLTLGSLHLLTKEGASEAELHCKTKLTRLRLLFDVLIDDAVAAAAAADDDDDDDAAAAADDDDDAAAAAAADGATHHDLDHHHKQAINQDEDVLEALQPHLAGIQHLEIVGYRGVRWPRWMVDPSIHRGFPSLEGCWWWETANHGWEEQPQIPVILPRLRIHKIYGCPMLRRLPPALSPMLQELIIEDCPKLEWASSSTSSSSSSSSSSSLLIGPPLNGKPHGGHLFLSSSLVELEVAVLHGGGANGDDDPQVTQLLACLQGLRSLQKLKIRVERMSEAATAHISGTNIIATTMTGGMLLSSPGEGLLQSLMYLRRLGISKCPLLTPLHSFTANISFNRQPMRMAAEHHIPCNNNNNNDNVNSHPSSGGGGSSSSSSSLLQLSSSAITTTSSSSSSSQPREPQKIRRLEELTFSGSTPRQMISKILRGMVSFLLPVALRFDSCDELRFFGDDCEEADELDVNSTGGGIGSGESSELEASLLDHLAPSLSRLEFIGCKNLQRLPPKLSCFSSLQVLVIRFCVKIESLPEAGLPPSLSRLEFYFCRNLQRLPAKLSCLSSLKVLEIVFCDKIEYLPDAGLPPSLQELIIWGCPKLGERCREKAGADWPKICHIPRCNVRRGW